MTKLNVRMIFLGTLVAYFLLGSGMQRRAQASCWVGGYWSSWPDATIPVYLNQNMAAELCPNTSCSTTAQMEWILKDAMYEFWRRTGTAIQFQYMGTTNNAPAANMCGAVHLYAHTANTGMCADGYAGYATVTGHDWLNCGGLYGADPRGQIGICKYRADGVTPRIWLPGATDVTSGNEVNLRGLLIHELAHVVGLGDAYEADDECYTTPNIQSIMLNSGEGHLFPPDIDVLQANWGLRTRNAHAYDTTDGVTWSAGKTAPSTYTSQILGRFAMTNSRTGSRARVGFVRSATNDGILTNYEGGGWTYAQWLYNTVRYDIGVAAQSNSTWNYNYLGQYNTVTGVCTVQTNGTTGWADISTSDSNTANPGVASTYDQASGQYIRMWRGGNAGGSDPKYNRIWYRVGTGYPEFELKDAYGNVEYAADTPSIACGKVSVVGTRNCLIAWTGADDWNRVVRYNQYSVNTSTGALVPYYATALTHNYPSIGGPSVTYWSQGTYPWMIALHQAGSATYTWRKRGAAYYGWQDQRSVSQLPLAMPPTLGSRYNSSGFEAATLLQHGN